MSSRSDDPEGVDRGDVDGAPTDDPTGAEDDESVWRFGIDEVGEGAEPDRPPQPPLEPEPVELENALFVLVGVAGTLLVLVGSL